MKKNQIKKALDTLVCALREKYPDTDKSSALLMVKVDGNVSLDDDEGCVVCDDRTSTMVAQELQS